MTLRGDDRRGLSPQTDHWSPLSGTEMAPTRSGPWDALAQDLSEPTDPVSDVGRVALREAN